MGVRMSYNRTEDRARPRRHRAKSQMPAATLPTEEPARIAQCRAAASAADALGRYMLEHEVGPDDLLLLRLGELGEGHDVGLLPHDREVSTVVAARLLGVSRPHFVKLLEQERVMDFRKVG